jgi:hypothetical protein
MVLASSMNQWPVIYRYIVADFIFICKRKPSRRKKMEKMQNLRTFRHSRAFFQKSVKFRRRD